MVAVRGVDIIIFGLPPTDHSFRRGRARTFTGAAGCKDSCDFRSTERSVKNFRFVDQTAHNMDGADVATDEQVRSSGEGGSDARGLGRNLDSVYINFPITTIECRSHVVP